VTLYWNIWNSRKIILMSPKKEKLYYSKLWRKKERGKISFSNHKCVSCLKPTRSSTTLQNIFTFFFYYQLTKNYTHGAKKKVWCSTKVGALCSTSKSWYRHSSYFIFSWLNSTKFNSNVIAHEGPVAIREQERRNRGAGGHTASPLTHNLTE